jgi:hypothetical protein
MDRCTASLIHTPKPDRLDAQASDRLSHRIGFD